MVSSFGWPPEAAGMSSADGGPRAGRDWQFNPRAGQGQVGEAPGKGRYDMESQTFGRDERIRKRQDYLRIYQQGVRSYSAHFTIITCRNQAGIRRLGMTVSKKAGNAVQRNRIKRLLREFFRLNKSRLPASQDIVIIAKRGILPMMYRDVCTELESRLIQKADA
jgi:ribonuclease P protein component